VYEVPSPLVGQYTFRYPQGVLELERLMYGDPEAGIANLDPLSLLDRATMALILYEKLDLQTVAIYNKDYYDHTKYNHLYGSYMDMTEAYPWFNAIETATMKGYMQPYKDENQQEWFHPKALVTDEAIQLALSVINDTSAYESVLVGKKPMTVGMFLEILEAMEGKRHVNRQ
jgi:hypothetical protein